MAMVNKQSAAMSTLIKDDGPPYSPEYPGRMGGIAARDWAESTLRALAEPGSSMKILVNLHRSSAKDDLPVGYHGVMFILSFTPPEAACQFIHD